MIFQMKLSSITSLTMGLLSYELRTTCRIGLQGEKKNGKKKKTEKKNLRKILVNHLRRKEPVASLLTPDVLGLLKFSLLLVPHSRSLGMKCMLQYQFQTLYFLIKTSRLRTRPASRPGNVAWSRRRPHLTLYFF